MVEAIGAYHSRYYSHYTSGFLRRFTACIMIVAWKLAQPTECPLASVAEQLAALELTRFGRVVFPHPNVLCLYQRGLWEYLFYLLGALPKNIQVPDNMVCMVSARSVEA